MASEPVQNTAAVSWIDANGNAQLHVFSCDGNNFVQRYWDGSGWQTGPLSKPAAHVSATARYDATHGVSIRVYATVAFEGTTEWCFDESGTGQWYKGAYTLS